MPLAFPLQPFLQQFPLKQKVNFFIFKVDSQIDAANRLSIRFNRFTNLSPDNIAGGTNTLERSIDFDDKSSSLAIQLASVASQNILNEFRFQFAKRDSRNIANANSGIGPSIVISDIDGIPTNGAAGANFGAPENDDTIAPLQKSTQFLNNLTWTIGSHAVKVGVGVNFIDDIRRTNSFTRYTFQSAATYNQARTGVNQRSYTSFQQIFGDTGAAFDSTYYSFFAQDDWKASSKLKVNYGVRYDQYRIPNADINSPFVPSQKFKVDKNNFAPRLGIVYGLSEKTVLRASAGIYYDTVYSDFYLRAIQANGRPSFFTVSFNSPLSALAPNFPNQTSTANTPLQDITSIASDLENMYAIHYNVQLERILAKDISVTAGLIRSNGKHIPIYRSINRVRTGFTLADGRPTFIGGTTVNASTRIDPRFNNILIAEASGSSTYNAFTLQLNKRLSKGYQFSVNYTLSKSEDDAPEQNLVATQVGNLVLQDPTNRNRDFGPSLADQRHTFVASFVGRPTFDFESKGLNYLLNNNQVGIIASVNNGERFNIVSSTDINGDGFIGSDNPVGIGRNSGKTPKQTNVDLRYSRFFNFTERLKLEFFGEFTNIFNLNSIFQFNSLTVTTDAATGNPTSALPNLQNRRAANQIVSLDSRQFQLGFKFKF